MLRLNNLRQLTRITINLYPKQITTAFEHSSNIKELAATPVRHQLPNQLGASRNIFISTRLDKYKRKSGAQDDESDSEDEQDVEFKDERDSKVIKSKVNSLRADLLLKAGLGIARK